MAKSGPRRLNVGCWGKTRPRSECPELRLLAEAVEEVGADRFCATIAPAGSNRRSHGGNEVAEPFGIACHELVSLDFRFGSQPVLADLVQNVGC